MDYKETLLMPKTEFQMKGNLAENEVIQAKKWEDMNLYAKVREKNKGKKFAYSEQKRLNLQAQ